MSRASRGQAQLRLLVSGLLLAVLLAVVASCGGGGGGGPTAPPPPQTGIVFTAAGTGAANSISLASGSGTSGSVLVLELRATQVKPLPSSSVVTCQSVGGSFGWRIRALFPGASGPLSRRWMLRTVGVHSGQRSISLITAHTRCGGAPISIVMLKSSMIDLSLQMS